VVTHDNRMCQFASNIIYLLDGLTVSEAEYEAASHFEIEEEVEEVE